MKPETNMNRECIDKICEGEYKVIKQGHWVKLVFMLMCSECGWNVLFFENYKFCPHCGARMDGDENEQEKED